MMRLFALALLGLAALFTGCATTTPSTAPAGTAAGPAAPAAAQAVNKADPWESLNRKIYAFNDGVDTVLLRPVAEAYVAVVPSLLRAGVSNVFGNVGDAWSAVNQLLQGKVLNSLEMTTRFITNTTLGLAGLLDPASEMGLERKSEDFGQTMGVWGLPTGPFLMLPLLGPSSVRETGALVVDRVASLPNQFNDRRYVNSLTALELVGVRAELLPATRMLDQIALDKYSFVRDAYIARRRNQVYDGNPPPEPEEPDAAEKQTPDKPMAKESAPKEPSPKEGVPPK